MEIVQVFMTMILFLLYFLYVNVSKDTEKMCALRTEIFKIKKNCLTKLNARENFFP